MSFLIDNWYVIMGILALLIFAGYLVYKFAGLPTKEQLDRIKELLLYWVTEAEKELGSGTGELKLRYVYNLFVNKFPVTAKIISFDLFSDWVDEALEEMRELLSTNKAINNLVTGKTEGEA